MKDNKINRRKYRLISAAATNRCGYCWFHVGNPSGWYGQSLVSEKALKEITPTSTILKILDLLKIRSRITYENRIIQRVPCVDLKEVIRGIERLDYMMLDVQGAEEPFLLECPEFLSEKVRMVNIGTHGNIIETNLRKYFTDLGWTNTFDIPMNSRIRFNIGEKRTEIIQFGDGVQVWVNPVL